MFKNKVIERDVIVLSHVKPISEKESVAFAKYIYEMSNHHYFQYFIMAFREQLLNSASENVEMAGLLKFIKLFREKVEAVAKVYIEESSENEEGK